MIGCSTNAKQSVLITWLPRALAAGAEIRDLAMVGRIETTTPAAPPACTIIREGRWRFQNARNVVVAGYAIETPRLLLNSATEPLSRWACQFLGPGRQEPDGAVKPGGVGHHGREIRSYKGPPSLAITEHWNYADDGKDFFGGYAT